MIKLGLKRVATIVVAAVAVFATGMLTTGERTALAAGDEPQTAEPAQTKQSETKPSESKPAETKPAEAEKSEAATWDQAASIRGAAERLGRIHRARGAKAAYELIDNCYRTHSLASTYGEGFESCIAQDYLETRTLIQVYSRMPPEALKQHGVPSPKQLADSMGQRVSAAFQQYKKSQAYADEVRALVDRHGLPVFLAIVFPEAVRAVGTKKSDDKKSNEKK